MALCLEAAVGLGLGLSGLGEKVGSVLQALVADDGFISETLERFGFVSFLSSNGLLPMSGTFSHSSLVSDQLLFIFYVLV